MTDVIIATAIGMACAVTLYGICCLLDAFISMQTGEDVALEDVPPTIELCAPCVTNLVCARDSKCVRRKTRDCTEKASPNERRVMRNS